MFEISILQETLIAVLNYIEPTVGKNSQNLGDDCISMESTDTGSCIFYTTNMIESTIIESACSNATKQAMAPYVNFKKFKGIISTIPAKEYIIIKEGVNELLISFQMRKVPIKLVGNNNGMLPRPTIIDNLPNDMVDVPIAFFNQAVTNASTIIQESNTTQTMNCVRFTIGNPDITAEAIDMNSKRTFMVTEKSGTVSSPISFLIEANKMQKSLKLFEDFVDIEIGKDNSMILLKGNNRAVYYNQKQKVASADIMNVFYCLRQIVGVYPNVAQYYTTAYYPTEFITVNKKDLLNSISRIKAIGDDTSFHTGISIKADKKEFTTSFTSQYGSIEDPIDVVNAIKSSFNMIFNHKQLEDIIKTIDTEDVDIGQMQGAQGNFFIKPNPSSNITGMFSILSMASQQQTP